MKQIHKPWFDVDRVGLAKLMEGRSKAFVVFELVQNAWDQNVSRVDIDFSPTAGQPSARITVTDDDPDGFQDIRHAYTLFAESTKKNNPEKAGRFDIGEKFVLALCSEATIVTTTGGVRFLPDGRRESLRQKRSAGSEFSGKVRMNRAEYDEALAALYTLLPKDGIETYINGALLQPRAALAVIEAKLKTVIGDSSGILRELKRDTEIRIYEPKENESAKLYELGIPVVETGDRWHVDVRQKVPLNTDRDNVPPAYLRDLRTVILNHMSGILTADDATAGWVNEALGNKMVTDEAVAAVLDARYGKDRVGPSLKSESNKKAVAAGYQVIPPRAFTAEQWENIRRANAARPADQLFPVLEPYGQNGRPEQVLPPSGWTDAIRSAVAYAQALGVELLERSIQVRVADEPKAPWRANYGGGVLTLNFGRLGNAWFESFASIDMNSLLLHEFGHEFEMDHLSENYYRAICKLGAKMTALALSRSSIFRPSASVLTAAPSLFENGNASNKEWDTASK